jgi:chromosome segregation ATPase
MSTARGRNPCISCGKEKATLRCGGCLQEFCFNHSTNHRQELSKQLEEVEINCDLFRQTFIEQTTDSQEYQLIKQINDWEHDSIKNIQQTAHEIKQILFNHTNENIKQIQVNLNNLTNQLRQCHQENDFHETDLQQWNEELAKLSKKLAKLSNITFRESSKSLINNISLDITLGECICWISKIVL